MPFYETSLGYVILMSLTYWWQCFSIFFF